MALKMHEMQTTIINVHMTANFFLWLVFTNSIFEQNFCLVLPVSFFAHLMALSTDHLIYYQVLFNSELEPTN